MERHFEAAGVHDMRHLTVTDCAGSWLTLGVVQAEPLPLAGTREGWERLHHVLGATLANQQVLDALRSRFERGGDHEHGRVREELVALDAGASGLAPSDAEGLWKELCAGRLRVVDQFDRGRRRYLLLGVAWEDGALDPRQLTPAEAALAARLAEGRSDKWLALTLGVARSTVCARSRQVFAKLGVGSRRELARAFRACSEAAVPALSLRAHAIGLVRASRTYLLAFDREPSSDPLERHPSLTDAEWRVVRLAVAGYGDREIAALLSISPHTVSNQLRSAYARLGVGARVELSAALRRT